MFSLIRRISYGVIPRPDRPWEEDGESTLLILDGDAVSCRCRRRCQASTSISRSFMVWRGVGLT
jgi:hypothetical protein